MMTPDITLTEAMANQSLIGGAYRSSSFWTWKVVAKLIDGLPLTEPREIDLFEQCTGRTYNGQTRRAAVRRFILLAGRRAGKDRFLSGVGVWRSALCTDWRKYISPGEQAVVLLLGADKKQAAILRRYCRGLLEAPLLAEQVTRSTDEVIEFKNGSSLEIATNDARLVRGRSAIAVLGSECCYWRTDEHSSSSDEEVVGAAEPSMAMCPDSGLLLLGSSVYRKRGYMFRKYRELHGNNDAADASGICWFAPSTVMNQKLPQSVVDQALAENPPKARAEFLGIWREDMADFCPHDVVEVDTDRGVFERPPMRGINYLCHVDAAGGTGSDSITLGIAHAEPDTDRVVLDVLRERKPRFIPRDVIAEWAQLLKSYNISEVQGDSFAGGFHADEWARQHVRFKACDNSTSENYLAALPLLLSGRARLLDHASLRSQITSLERYAQANGHEVVRHPATASAHDDLATSAAGALVAAAQRFRYDRSYGAWVEPRTPERSEADAWQMARYQMLFANHGLVR